MKINRRGALAGRVMALVLAVMLLTGSALASMKAYVYSDSRKVYKKAASDSKLMVYPGKRWGGEYTGSLGLTGTYHYISNRQSTSIYYIEQGTWLNIL